MQFTIPAFLFSTALPIKQLSSEKTTCGQYTHYEKVFSAWTEPAPPPSSASLRPPPLLPPPIAFYHHIWKDSEARFSVKWSWYRRTHAILPHSTFGQKWVKDAILYGFTRPQTGFFRFPIADSNLEIFDENEKFQMPVAALYGNKKKIRCQLPHLQFPVAALPYEKLVNSLLPHMQTHPLFTFLIVSLDSDNQIQQNFGTMYRNGRQIVSIIDIFSILHRTL